MKRELIAHNDPKSPVSEVYRTLRTNIQFMNTNRKLKTLLITSTLPGEGKSWVSSNLAVTFAQAGKKVILVDADMRKGRQYSIFGVSPKPGISNYLSGIDENENENENEKNISKYIQETEIENLYVMSAGNIPPNPSELLISPKMVQLVEKLKNISDIVIIDGTPSELVTDSMILARLVDSTVIVAEYGGTKKDNLKRVVNSIKNVGG
ncbi:MAG: CpsD/CapB family tyrosine-protein kinase, partial [Bacteroidales bacterium]